MPALKNSLIFNPLVSIIIPVYNAERFIAETITSALNQTWENKEILLVDDGSEDASFSIIKTFEKQNVKVFHQENLGASAARNLGIKEAQGNYIQFLDADDLLEETKIEQQLKAMDFAEDCLSICPVIHFPNGEFYKGFSPTEYEKTFYQSSSNPLDFLLKLYGAENDQAGMIALHAWLVPKKLINKAGLWNESLTVDDDGEYFCRVVLSSKKIIFTDKTACYYRKFNNRKNLSAQLSQDGLESMLQSLDLKQQHLATQYDVKSVNKILAGHYWNIALLAYPQFKALYAKAAVKAKAGCYKGRKYNGGPISNILSIFFGWRLMRYISFLRYGF